MTRDMRYGESLSDACPSCQDRGWRWHGNATGGADRVPCHCPAGWSFAAPLRPRANQAPIGAKDGELL